MGGDVGGERCEEGGEWWEVRGERGGRVGV